MSNLEGFETNGNGFEFEIRRRGLFRLVWKQESTIFKIQGQRIRRFWAFEIGVWNLFGARKSGFGIFVPQGRVKFLPNIIDPLKHSKVGEDG